LGGDVDSTAAILGGLAGACCGDEAIPREWLDGLIEYPYSVTWMKTVLAPALRKQFGSEPIRPVHDAEATDGTMAAREPVGVRPPLPLVINGLTILGRNLFFFIVVLVHGVRRLLPPY